MENEINTQHQQSQNPIPSGAGVNVIVVDDDVVCLSIVAGILRTWKYEVVTVRNPLDALATLRSGANFFHIVVTDVHMPEMNGFEFQKKVQEEFHLPVVMMSADDKESTILRGLESGAAFFIVKPVNYNDLKNIWQFAVNPEKGKSDDNKRQDVNNGEAPMEEPPPPPPVAEEPPVEKPPDNPIHHIESVQSSVNGVNQPKREPRRRASKRVINIQDSSERDNSDAVSARRTKIVWTTALHNRFLEAVRKIGLERAVPKRILEIMNTPELTRENIASHLQKYRLFLRRVAEASNNNGSNSKGKNTVERTLRSSFATGHPTLLLKALQKGYPQLLNQQLVGSILLQGLPENIQVVNDPTLSEALLMPNQQASTSIPIPQLLGNNGQSNSVNNQSCSQQQPVGRNSDDVRPETNGEEMNDANPGQVNQQETQPRSNLAPSATPSSIHGVHSPGSFSSLLRNFVSGRMGYFESDEVSTGFNGSYNGNRNSSSSANVNSAGYYAREASSYSVGFPPRFQQNDIGNGVGESSSYLLDHLMNTTHPMEAFTPSQFGESDIDEILRGHFSNLNTNEQQAEEEVQSQAVNNLNNNAVENNNPPVINQMSSINNQMESGGYMMGYFGNGIEQLDEYFLNYEPHNPNLQRGGGAYQQPAPYSRYPTMSLAGNQGKNSDFMDSMFGRGKY